MNDDNHSEEEKGGCGHSHDSSGSGQAGGMWVISSGLLLGAGLILQFSGFKDDIIPTIAFLLATILGGILVVPAALASLRKWRFDMNVLMTVAVTGAWCVGEGAEGAAVVFLFALSELLESWSVSRARRAIASLMELAPETALVQDSTGKLTETAVEEVQVGQIIRIQSGAKIPLDGNIISGSSSINQAPITGESVPVDKKQGDKVFAGTINGDGSLMVEVVKASSDSTLAKIIKLVGEAEAQKAPMQRFVDKFARIYTPVVFCVAIVVAVTIPLLTGGNWNEWIYRALAFLVIACPCALVIATPVSIVSGLTALARGGILVKGGAYLESIGKLRALAVDKTGTITQGRPQVREVVTMTWLAEDEVLRRAAAIDAHSTHPLAKAVVEEASKKGIEWPNASNYRSITGRGATADIEDHPYFIGNHKLAHEYGVCTPDVESKLAEIESRGESVAVIGHIPHNSCDGEILGIIGIGDALRDEAQEALQMLHQVGIEKVVMLSGDNQRTVDTIAKQAGIDEARGDLMPEQKIEHIRRLMREYQYVGMVGDGVNDAPALALASVGIAMGAIGSDTAIETADVALMNDDLTKISEVIATGRKTLRIIQFNIVFAICVKAMFLVLAFLGKTNLWMAILADTGATLLVILNALRLLKKNYRKEG